MTSLIRPLLRPGPLIGISTAGIIAATIAQTRKTTVASMSSASGAWPATAYEPRHKEWPYKPLDFTRFDEASDTTFYSAPRFVTHIDDAAIATLSEYYREVLPRTGRILDFCTSWVSHFPPDVEKEVESGALQVIGMGMNKAELDKNSMLNGGRILQDLNEDPDIGKALATVGVSAEQGLDAAVCVVSIDYLTKPVELLKSLHNVMKPGSTLHLIISNRCFPTKVIHRWLLISEQERLPTVGDFLHFAGWQNIEILTLSDGKTGIGGRRDPLWVVRATK